MAACETASFSGLLGVHIHSCGCGRWRFRSYSESLLPNAVKVTKRACPSMGPSLGLGVPSLRHCSGGRRQPAIPGRVAASSASLPSCPLRNAYARPAGKGPEDQDQDQEQKQKQKQSAFYALFVGAGLPAKRPVSHAASGRTSSLASQLLQEVVGGTPHSIFRPAATPPSDFAFAFAFAFDLPAPLDTMAERRH